jgi:hypothetical protein
MMWRTTSIPKKTSRVWELSYENELIGSFRIIESFVITITLCEDRLFFGCAKMLDLDLCLSVSVNIRYILHTQPHRFI